MVNMLLRASLVAKNDVHRYGDARREFGEWTKSSLQFCERGRDNVVPSIHFNFTKCFESAIPY